MKRYIIALFRVAVVGTTLLSCRPSEKGKQSQLGGFESNRFEVREWTSLRSGETVKLVSQTEAELGKPGDILLCQYTEQGGTIRIVLNVLGTSRVQYFDVENNGDVLRAQGVGEVFLTPSAMQQEMKRRQEASGQVTKGISNARQLAIAVRLYAADKGGKYPATLEDLVASGAIIQDVLDKAQSFKPAGWQGEPGFEYRGAGMTDSDPGSKVLLISKCQDNKGRRIVGTNDTSVEVRMSPSP